MKNKGIFVLTAGILLITAGWFGRYNSSQTEQFYADKQTVWTQSNMMNVKNHNGNIPMMDFDTFDNYENYELLSVEILEERVNDYLTYYETDLVISDIFIYEDSDYYFSVVEEETGRGAIELLVNPYTGNVYPDFGPNMMWNLKYGMHGSGGMRSGRGMMSGRHMNSYDYNDIDYDHAINHEEAYNYGVSYLDKYYDNLQLSQDFIEFYGYFTFHIDKDNKTMGILSVNGLTGDVWYHEWHGNLVEVIEVYNVESN